MPLAPPPPHADAPLVDRHGRRVTYLRLSLTRRCNFRCSYCTPCPCGERPEGVLDRDEIRAVVAAFARLGVRRVRLTGGEPTLRPDLCRVAEVIAGIRGIEEIALTTNGQRLGALAPRLHAAGVSRVNVSLDTLRPERLRAISGPTASLERVVQGIEAAARTGFAALKINTVVLGGVNEDELGDLVRFAWGAGAVPRFIELMPFGRGERVPVASMRGRLVEQGVSLGPAEPSRGWGPATYHLARSRVGGTTLAGAIGFIGAMSESFCATCNRVRVGPDGTLRACLGGRDEVPLRDLLAPGASCAALEQRIRGALLTKASQHELGTRTAAAHSLSMAGIGG